jgi:hypothetical protein
VCILGFYLLLRLNLNVKVDLDFLVLEVVVQSESRGGLGLGTIRASNEDLGLQQDAEIGVEDFGSQGSGLFNIGVGETIGLIKEQQNTHLVGRNLEGVGHLGTFDVVGLDFTFA